MIWMLVAVRPTAVEDAGGPLGTANIGMYRDYKTELSGHGNMGEFCELDSLLSTFYLSMKHNATKVTFTLEFNNPDSTKCFQSQTKYSNRTCMPMTRARDRAI